MLAFVAAEAREFSGLLRHAERTVKLNWPLDFARMVWFDGKAAVLVANGPGPKLAGQAVEIAKGRQKLSGLVSTGFCGALDPAIQPLDIFIPTEILAPLDWQAKAPANSAVNPITTNRPYQTGILISQNHVASTIAEKSELRKTSASAIEMEAAAVYEKAQQYHLAFYCIRVVTDTATESFPLDFNKLRDADGRFSIAKILSAAIRRPSVFPALMKLNKRSKDAAQALGDFIADTRF